jgi:hypothetical protein
MCKHWNWDGGEQGYSHLTPGSDVSTECVKGHWGFDHDSQNEFRLKLLTASECADFELVELKP